MLIAALTVFPAPCEGLAVTKKTLANGLQVFHVPRHNLPVVVITLLVKASPADEPAGKEGTAHLTAKMLTEGTATRTAKEISGDLDFTGATLSISAHSDFTTLSLSLLKKDVGKGLAIFSDVLMNPSFPEDELKRRKDLLKGSLRQREEEPGYVAGKAFIAEVFGVAHPYGRPVEGNLQSIDGITRSDVLSFHQRAYRPGNAMLSVVGDIDGRELEGILDRHFAGWQPRVPQESDAGLSERIRMPGRASLKSIVIDRDLTQANIVLGHEGVSRDNPDYYAISVMNYILGGGGFASRLMKVVRDEKGLTYSIHSSFVSQKAPGYFQVEVQTKNESAGQVIAEILAQMEKMRRERVTDQELADAKAFLTGSFPRRIETTKKVADFLAVMNFYGLGDDYIEKYPSYINAVTADDVLRVARKYLNPSNYVLVVVGKQEKLGLSQTEKP